MVGKKKATAMAFNYMSSMENYSQKPPKIVMATESIDGVKHTIQIVGGHKYVILKSTKKRTMSIDYETYLSMPKADRERLLEDE